MHKLNRPNNGPLCLADYDHTSQKWDDMASLDKSSIRTSLDTMQANHCGQSICAYCECPIYDRGHIEHFRRKNKKKGFPELTFSWENLFLSCNSSEHCGHFKDRHGAAPYNPDHLVKPDEMDPDDYLYFHSSGVVRTREDLIETDTNRAKTTINVFGLNNKALEGSRSSALKAYKKISEDYLDEIENWSESDKFEYLTSEIKQTANDPYATTIRHYLLRH